jgi:dimethylargininase
MTLRPLSRRLFAALVAGFAASGTAFAAVVLAFFLVSGAAPAQLGGIALYFFATSVALVVLLGVAAYFGALTIWYRALGIAVVAGLISAYLGTLAFLVHAGDDPATASAATVPTFVGSNLPFLIATIIVTLTIARRAHIWALGVRLEGADEVHRVALVRSPASTLAKGEVTHVKRKPVKVALADTQWEAYVEALESEGFTTIEIEQSDEHPDSVFIEDTVVMLGQTAIIGSPGAESRRGEPDAVAATLKDLGLTVHQIRLPGTLDGGDVLKIDRTIYVGRGGRTNAEGIRQFRELVGELGYTVVAVPVTKALHLKSTVTALPDGTVIGHKTLVDNPAIFDRYLEVPEAAGVAVVVLSQSSVLISASAPKTAALIEDLGYRVVTVDISEFEKLEGCVTCLSVRIR